ncbi:unnamed protein product [Larinioides sclopetarius]|uniref:Uncharacterized protein n=1 Tax=Larinioides sclopetarius TaxID=280406 RepID=A0AAV2ALW7_9ARAC
MGGYEVTADSEQPMMFRVCLSAIETDQWLPPKKSHVGVFDVTCIRSIGDSRIPIYLHAIAMLKRPDTDKFYANEASAVRSTILNEVRCQCVEFTVNRVLMVPHKVSAAIVMEMCSTSEF